MNSKIQEGIQSFQTRYIMNTIKGLLKLGGVASAREMMELDEAARLILEHSNISFKIISVGDNTITVKASQGKQADGHYADTKKLHIRTTELFMKYLPELKIVVQPVPFQVAQVDVVQPEWLAEKLLQTGIKIKDIQADTGIDKTNLSAWIKGTRPMSQPVKAMFYYYFQITRKVTATDHEQPEQNSSAAESAEMGHA